MNIQQLIDKYGEKFKLISKDYPYDRALSELWYDIKKLDEPPKAKVPQFVAEKIEYFKKTGDWDLFQAMDDLFEHTKTCEWLEVKDNQELFARAWLDGYEVKEEKRYRVKIKNVYHGDLGHAAPFEQFSFYNKECNLSGIRYEFNRKELEEAGFGWVFNCEGVEIEEVEG